LLGVHRPSPHPLRDGRGEAFPERLEREEGTWVDLEPELAVDRGR
jgi:hypothetical protein